MPRPPPVLVRQAIWRRSQDGQDGLTTAQVLRLAPRTVRQLLRRFRRDGQDARIPSSDLRYGDAEARAIRRADRLELAPRASHLGSEIGVRVMFHRRLPNDPLPAVRTL